MEGGMKEVTEEVTEEETKERRTREVEEGEKLP